MTPLLASTGGMSVYAKFESELAVRPDDIDLYQHVHSTRYLDYVLAARFEQMERCYGMGMAEFSRRGLGWFMATAQIAFKRPLGLGDRMIVRTWIESFSSHGCRVPFQIERADNRKLCCDGACDYVLVTLADGRPTPLPADVVEKYTIRANP